MSHGVDGGEDLNHTIGQNAHIDFFLHGVAARPLEKRGNPQAAPQALGLRGFGASVKPIPIGEGECLVHDGFKIPRVIGLGHGVFVGHLAGLDHVHAPERQAVNATHPRGLVHQTLDVEDRLRTARTPVGASGGGVGHHGFEVVVYEANVIDPGLHPRANEQLDRHPGHAGIGAHIGDVRDLQGHDFAVRVKRHARMAQHVSAMATGQKVLRSLGLPFDGALQLVGAKRHHQVLGVGAGFHAKSATHIAHHHANVCCGNAKQVGNLGVRGAGHLRAHAHDQAAILDVGLHTAWLQRQRNQALVHDLQGDGVRGRFEGRLGLRAVAIAGLGHNIVGHIRQQWCLLGQGVLQGDRAGQGVVFHHHGFAGVFGHLQTARDHGHHRFTHKAHALGGQNRANR